MDSERYFIAADWGSTRLRLYLLDDAAENRHGPPAAEFRSDLGIGAVEPGRHAEVFLEACGALLKSFPAGSGQPSYEAYFSGMITSTLGWLQTPYLRTPAGIEDLAAGARRLELSGTALRGLQGPRSLRLVFFPGVRAAEDVLRGEEVETFGLLPDEASRDDWLIVLPGTHSKWIDCRGGKIVDFSTVPTGDVHAALHRESLLARTLPPKPAPITPELEPSFHRGLQAAERDGPLSSLFKVRALAVLEDHHLKPEECSAFLSGVLIGGEVLERLARLGKRPIRVGGEPALRKLYLEALRRLAGDGSRDIRDAGPASGAAAGIRRVRKILSSVRPGS